MRNSDSRRRLLVLGVALFVDLCFGEPPEGLHPVVWMGRATGALADRAPKGERRRLLYGASCVFLLTVGPALLAGAVSRLLGGGRAGLLAEAWLLKTCLSYRALEEAGRAVAGPLEEGDTGRAREALASLVSRERSRLDAPLVAAAAIESLAENLSDGFTAPVLAYGAGGLPGAFFYRATNTADAMIGYRDERYEHLGKAAARLDDLLNLFPARLTALALAAASGSSALGALEVLGRERRRTESPNAGWPMSAVAGSLGVALEKPAHYRLNPEGRNPEPGDIHRALALCRRAAVLCAGAGALLALSWGGR